MHVWIDLIAREGAYLALLLALGAAPASLLSADRLGTAGRLALAPVLGFCLGTCVFTTVLEFVPAGDSSWLLIPLALASLTFAAWRCRWRLLPRISWHEALQLLLIVVVVAGPLTAALGHHGTVGPAAYTYTDVDGFVAEQDGAIRTSTHDARAAWERYEETGDRYADLTQWAWSFSAWFGQNLDAAPLNANFTTLLGLGATDTFSSFLIVLLLTGALTAFAAVRQLTASRTCFAALAGALYGGPLFLELWFDSFQAVIVALALLLPLVYLAVANLTGRRWQDLVLLAIVAGTVLTSYPVYLPVIVAAGGLALVLRVAVAQRRGDDVRAVVRDLAIRLAALIGMVMILSPVGITRDIRFYRRVLNDEVPLPRVPWHLPLEVLPGWLLQTRGFWFLPTLGAGGSKQLVLAVLIPLAMLAVIAFGIRRYPAGLVLVGLGAVFGLLAEYSFASQQSCTYCAGRALLPIAAIAAVLLAVGLHALYTIRACATGA